MRTFSFSRVSTVSSSIVSGKDLPAMRRVSVVIVDHLTGRRRLHFLLSSL